MVTTAKLKPDVASTLASIEEKSSINEADFVDDFPPLFCSARPDITGTRAVRIMG